MTDLSNEVSRHKHVHNHTNVQKTESYILRTVFKFFLNIDFQCPKGGFTFNEKNSHNNDDYAITGVEKM